MGKSKELATLTDVGGTIDGALTVDGGYTDLETQDVNNYARITTVNGSAQLGLYRSGSAEGGFYLGGDVDKFRVYDSSFTPRMEVDASGRVTMPYQPSFKVHLSTAYYTGTNESKVTGWSTSIQGSTTGTGYNSGHFVNDRFTAPVAGRYLFNLSTLHHAGVSGSGSWVRFYWYKNGSVYQDNLGDQGTYGAYQRNTGSIIIDMAVNDYCEIYANDQNGDSDNGYLYAGYSYWSGQLLG